MPGIKYHLFVLVFSLCFQPALAEQQSHGHKGILTPYTSEPEKIILNKKESHRLEQGKAIFRKQVIGDDKRAVAIFQVNAKPATVWSVLKDFAHYPDWINDIQSAEVYKQDEGLLYVRFDATSRIIGKSTWFARHDYPMDGQEWGTWTLDYNYRSDLDDSVGYWRVTPVQDGSDKSIVSYSATLKLRARVPTFIVDLIVKSRLKQTTLWVKEQAEIRQQTLPD